MIRSWAIVVREPALRTFLERNPETLCSQTYSLETKRLKY